MAENTLYYGDNLDILRRYVADESVDLVYLDPPFNSNQNYNVLFAERDGSRAAAQIQAFEDTWEWSLEAEAEYTEVVQRGGRPSEVLQAFRTFLGTSDMMAYLAMMAPRLIELQRVLKSTGSLYLHCDPTASHYLKILLDAVFGPQEFCNEIVWKRTSAHSSARRYGPVHDVLLFYSKSDNYTWNNQFQPYEQEYLDTFFDHVDPDGRRWKRMDLTGAGTRNGETGEVWRGIDVTAKGRHWAYPPSELDQLDAAGRIHWPKKANGMPRLRQYEDDMQGVPLQDVWTDIRPLHNLAAERLHFQTQKPEALLARIIASSSKTGDHVLDPFCGCGTAIAAAQKMSRRWTGIDITHLAITLIKNRLRDGFGREIEKTFKVIGEPVSLPDAEDLATQDRYQFQWWALGLVGARPAPKDEKKGKDKGIDGRLYFVDDMKAGKANQVVFSVKSGAPKLGEVRDLGRVIEREKAAIGVFITLQEPTRDMRTEAASCGFYETPFGRQKYPRLQILTIKDLLDGKTIDMPWQQVTSTTFKRAPKAKPGKKEHQADLLGADRESAEQG
jgi:DNA modification methylase